MHPAVRKIFQMALKHPKLKRIFVSRNDIRTDPQDIYAKRGDGYSDPYAWIINKALDEWNMGGSCGNMGHHSVRLGTHELIKHEREYKKAVAECCRADATVASADLEKQQAIQMAIFKFKETPEYRRLNDKCVVAEARREQAYKVRTDVMPAYVGCEGAWYTKDAIRKMLKEKPCLKKKRSKSTLRAHGK